MISSTYSRDLGARLRARRRSLRLNQTEVADLAGTTQRSVSQVETGKASSLQLYASIAEVLGLRVTVVDHDQVGEPTEAVGS